MPDSQPRLQVLLHSGVQSSPAADRHANERHDRQGFNGPAEKGQGPTGSKHNPEIIYPAQHAVHPDGHDPVPAQLDRLSDPSPGV